MEERKNQKLLMLDLTWGNSRRNEFKPGQVILSILIKSYQVGTARFGTVWLVQSIGSVRCTPAHWLYGQGHHHGVGWDEMSTQTFSGQYLFLHTNSVLHNAHRNLTPWLWFTFIQATFTLLRFHFHPFLFMKTLSVHIAPFSNEYTMKTIGIHIAPAKRCC